MIDTSKDLKTFSIFFFYAAVVTLFSKHTAEMIFLVALMIWVGYIIWTEYKQVKEKLASLNQDGKYLVTLTKDVWISFSLTIICIMIMLTVIGAIHYLPSHMMWMTIVCCLVVYIIVLTFGIYFEKHSDAH